MDKQTDVSKLSRDELLARVYVLERRVAEQEQLVAEIEVAREEALTSARAKADFLANMSHEIRTPMNAVIGMTSIARSTADVERKDYCLSKIENASVHLLGVINDILDMSKIEAGKLELSEKVFNFEKMLQNVANVINFRVDEKKQHFSVHIDPNIPPAVVGDDQRITQVITNLLGNAVKFTPNEGSVRIDTLLEQEGEDGGVTLRVDVKDSGIGISADQQSRLFTSFQQAETDTTRKYGGTGLGLSISKSIVEKMGGSIWITSEIGKGSIFSFTIKLRRAREEDMLPLLPTNINWENIRVLVVDDSPEILELFNDVSSQFGFACDIVESGKAAISRISHHGPYNMFFIDWKMPGMNGMELTEKIKENSDEKSVVVMISAIEWGSIEGEAKKAGVDKFLSKPLFPSAIAECVANCLGTNIDEIRKNIAPPETEDHFENFNMLLAEDIDINREIVTALLEPTGINIDYAENGREAVRLFTENHRKYHLIFMDVQMPEMDGYEATRTIRASGFTNSKTIPIIAMTANVFREDIEQALSSGMNDHIGKPLDFGDVLARLRKYLGNQKF
jgi:signal transduction histidine kinase/CheY-like chemotaxis protein